MKFFFMIIGIVGSEAAKFTPETELKARIVIRAILSPPDVEGATSGECHLGGIDIWTKEECLAMGKKFIPHEPKKRCWEEYKKRNIEIAETGDEVYCITVKELPPTYTGMRFKLCYHCGTDTHVKSGGCWTVKYAKELGKKTGIIVI